MRILIIGAKGTLGRAVSEALAGADHEVIGASRRGDPRVDLADRGSVAAIFEAVGDLDAVVCCAASAPLTPMRELAGDGFADLVAAKLLGQVEVAVRGAARLNDGGSVTLTTGTIPEDTAGAAPGALVNAGLEAFVRAAITDLERGVRVNAVSPGWVAETLSELGMDPAEGTPAAEIARSYVELVEGAAQGEILRPGSS